ETILWGDLVLEVAIMKSDFVARPSVTNRLIPFWPIVKAALSAPMLLAVGVFFAFASMPASAFTMTFDENGGCTITGATCSGVLAPAPSTGLVSGNVLTFTLPSLVFTGEAVIFEPNGVTVSDVLQWYCSSGPGTCGTLMDTAGNVHAASNRMIFYSLDNN